ncbi:MAG: adenylate/guanylate cyclase domain-containing protein, partial [Deltaproteobacteria bacterium]|nr:adenylate/guanylate cyclase domain-containing protein [Deltaproteobacteria bacterium]
AGFTERTGQQSREESAAWLRRYESLLMPLVKVFKGRKVKAIGDAYLCTFESPTNALLFGMAAQDRLFDYNHEVPDAEKIRIRVSVNVGEVRIRKGDIFGEPVNIAARLESLTPAEEVWFTEAAYLAMTKSEIPSQEVGLHEFKGIQDAIRVYRVSPGPNYRLQGSEQPENGSDQDRGGQYQKEYPFGGVGLQKAEERGWVKSLAEVQGRVKEVGDRAIGGLKSLGSLVGRISKRVWISLAASLASIILVVLLWPSGPFDEVIDALDAGKKFKALKLIEKHEDFDTPIGKTWLAHVLLAHPEPDASRAGRLLMAAVESDETLLTKGRVVDDLISSLDRSSPTALMDFITARLNKEAVPKLVKASKHRRYWLRWNSIRLLKRIGALEQVDQGFAYIQDLRYAGSCSTRKLAAKKLAELKDRRALEHLRQAQKRSFIDNLCMGDTLEDAIRAVK